MGWLIGKLIKLTLLVIFLGIIAGIGFIFFVNPNHFKPQITQIVRDYTGQPFVINGSIDWSLRQHTIVNLHDVALGKTPDDKTPAIQIKEANIDFNIFSLLKNNVTINDIKLNNVVVDWALSKGLTSSKTTGRPLIVQNFAITNGSITVQDPTEHLNWALQNVALSATNMMLNSGQDVPSLQMQGDLVNIDHNTKYGLDTTIKYDDSKNLLTLDPLKVSWNDTIVEGNANIEQISTDPVISGSMSLNPTDVGAFLKKIDPYYANSNAKITHTLQMQTGYSYACKDQILDLTKFNLLIDKGTLSGDVKLGLTSPYHAEFNLNADNLDFMPLSMLGSALFPSIHTMTSFPVDLVKNVAVRGKLSGTQVLVNELVIDQLHMEVNGQGGVLQFMPVVINAYGGTHNASLNIDATQHEPVFLLNEQADKVDLEPWLKAFHGDGIINGSATVKASLHATGSDVTTLKQSIGGTVNLYVNNGMLYGFNANRIMQFSVQTAMEIFTELSSSPAANLNVLAVKRSSDWIKTQQDQPKTKFDHLEFTAQIEKGVSKQSTIAINNNIIDLKGSGQFTISDQSVNYDTTMIDRLDVNSDIKVLAGYIKSTPISMSITGTLSKPIFGPSVQSYITTVLNATKTDLLNQAVSKMVSVTPPNVKTPKSASDIFIDSLQSLNK